MAGSIRVAGHIIAEHDIPNDKVDIQNATIADSVQMASSGVTVRNISTVALASTQTVSNTTTLTTFFSPTYTPLFAGSKILGMLTMMGSFDDQSSLARKKMQITLSGNGITAIETNPNGEWNKGNYDYGNDGDEHFSHETLVLPLVTTSTVDTITATCKMANERTHVHCKFRIHGDNTLAETHITWIELK